MQPADGVDLRRAGVHGFAGFFLDVIQIAGVRAVVPLLAVELAELAGEGAYVGVVEVAVDVVVGGPAVEPTADRVGEFADAPNVGRGKEEVAVGEREAIAAGNLGADGVQTRVGPRGRGGCGEGTGRFECKRGHCGIFKKD